MIFAVDFDGTIVEHRFPEIGKEIPGAINTLKELQRCGHKVIIWTCRCESYLASALTWLNTQGFVPDAVNTNAVPCGAFAFPKVLADVYIDDRSFPPFTGWNDVWNVYLADSVGDYAERRLYN